MEDASSFEPSDYISPDLVSGSSQSASSSATSSSSLLNWNGAQMSALSTQYLSPTSVSLASLNGMDDLHMGSQQMLAEYTTGGTPDPAALSLIHHQSQQFHIQPHQSHQDQHPHQPQPFTNYHVAQGDIWMTQMHAYERDPDGQHQHQLWMSVDSALQQQQESDESLTTSSSSSSTQPTGGNGTTGSTSSSPRDTRDPEAKHEHHVELHFDGEGRPVNCLIGPGDDGSPSVLFAMDSDDFFGPNGF